MAVLGIVVVDYKSTGRTIRYVREELYKIKTPHRVVVVNNGGTPMSDAELAEGTGGQLLYSVQDQPDLKREVFILESQENLGYAKGNNLGVDFLRKHFAVKYYLFSNNDLELPYGDICELLIAKMECDTKIGCIGPKIVSRKGRYQSPQRFLTVWQRVIWSKLFYPFLLPFGQLWSEVIQDAPEGYYYRLAGCFLLIRAEAFEVVGGFDTGTFLYAEEQILAERMKRHGYCMYYTTEARVIHHHGMTTSQFLTSRANSTAMLESLFHYYRTYIGLSRLEARMFRFSATVYSHLYQPVLSIISLILHKCMNFMQKNKLVKRIESQNHP